MAHTRYKQPGGEDRSFETEVELLRTGGHEVICYEADNHDLDSMSAARAGTNTVFNPSAYRTMRHMCREYRPDIVHLQNTFPLLSPAVATAAKRQQIPVVQTIRNYRLQCVTGINYRDGAVCTDCSNRFIPIPGVIRGCYRGRRESAVVATMIGAHKLAGTWRRHVDGFIFLTHFARRELAGVIDLDSSFVKPNCVHPDPGMGSGSEGHALFVGRLTREKGVSTLVEAWRRDPTLPPLRIAGDGPLLNELRNATSELDSVTLLGRLGRDATDHEIGTASVVVVASEWWETFGRVVIESLAKGTPVVVANIGALAEVGDAPPASRLFTAGDPDSLARAVRSVSQNAPELRAQARAHFEAHYSARTNIEALEQIYEEVISRATSR